MDLYEYQAREVLQKYELNVADGVVLSDETYRSYEPSEFPVVIKAQVKVGGRGKAGGVKVANDLEDFREKCAQILGMDIKGHTVNQVLVVLAATIISEYYVSITFDRGEGQYLLMLSKAGGMDIEYIAQHHPEQLVKVYFDAINGLNEAIALDAVKNAGFDQILANEIVYVILHLWEAYLGIDATLVEINPLALVLEKQGDSISVLDAKITLDDSAAFRQKELFDKYSVITDSDPLEITAKEQGLAYVRLDGNVGIIGNGAGLVMSTLDLVELYGRECGAKAANFLDIGGGASEEHMQKSLSLVLSDKNVKSVLINVFGGLTQGSLVAEGIISAVEKLKEQLENSADANELPQIVVRLSGNEAFEGLQVLRSANIPEITVCENQIDAAKQAISFAVATKTAENAKAGVQ